MSFKKQILLLAILGGASPFALAQSTTTDSSSSNMGTSASVFNMSSIFSKKRWNAKYSNYVNGAAFGEPKGSSINHYAQLKYTVQKDWTVSGVFRADTNFEQQGKTESVLADSYLMLGHPIYQVESGPKIYGEFRYFLPVSQESKDARLAGVVSPRVYATYTYKRLELQNIVIPKIYLNQASSSGQKTFLLGNYLAASYRPMKNVTLDFAVYPEWTVKRGAGTSFNNLAAYPGFTVEIAKQVSISPYVEVFLAKPESKTTSLGAYFSAVLL